MFSLSVQSVGSTNERKGPEEAYHDNAVQGFRKREQKTKILQVLAKLEMQKNRGASYWDVHQPLWPQKLN